MSWTDRLSRAKWRDFEFLTDSHEAKGGRRLVVHEYPGGDIPRVEDLGIQAWDWSLNAYFIGENYDYARNEFLTLLSESGPAWLTHPWLGLLWARAREWSVSESNEKGGYCTVKITFIPGGETLQPVPDRGDIAKSRAVELAAAAVEDFELEEMSADAVQGYIAAIHQRLEALRRIISLATLPLAWAGQIMQVIQGVKTDLAEIAALPAAWADAFRGIAGALGLTDGVTDGLDAADRAAVVGRIARAAGETRRAVTITGVAATDAALFRNLAAEYALEQRMIATAALSAAVADYPTEADRDFALAAVDKACAALLPPAADTVFQALVTARAACLDALLAQDLQPAQRRDILHPLPAVLIAHNMGIAEDIFLSRNVVRHPLFVNGAVYG
ncbi:MAG: DNA circularization N-terminal domain-containing protein [Zoogloeaceae bacterium]|nr:DNA circularization N-terminal domain-containing protein [Zoogloeaceae bacterium]